MSIWAEIKHSINSNLDKPLDKLINGTKGLKKSENLYTTLYNETLSVKGDREITVPVKVTCNWQGSFNLKYILNSGTQNKNDLAQLLIYKNGSLIKTLYSSIYQEVDYVYTEEFMCSTNDTFTFILKNTGGNMSAIIVYLEYLGIYADLVDLSGVTVEEI